MQSVTGRERRREDDLQAGSAAVANGFEEPPRPLTSARADRRRAVRVALGLLIAVTLAGGLSAAGGAGRSGPTGQSGGVGAEGPTAPTTPTRTRPPTTAADPSLDRRSAVRLFRFEIPGGVLSPATTDGGAGHRVVAMPGCQVTIQLAGDQPRRIQECVERVPSDLAGTLVIGPREPLRFEVPGWASRIEDRYTILGPASSGIWTIEIPTCLTRSGDWLCGKWYATVEVRPRPRPPEAAE